ncbi:hypothetical protein QR680_015561 [Steinernema hermaphroditum]|uniref:Uncharacterized protein n=1 Tax=Steinernema hermaphroditum TaxID=289476 RepID=A0AA39H874_9BILA|nr:hypothetical protein QR680_015561 [Steinernema hermaphroditum]
MSAPDVFDQLFNRILDISAIVHIPLKLFSMYIVLNYSPKYMDSLPICILNVMFWNFVANLMGSLLHINPQFPEQCYRADGPIGAVTKNEQIYHAFHAGLFICILNCALGLSFAFPYRYLLFAHPKLMSRFKLRWGVGICVAIYAIFSALFSYMYTYYMVTYDEYFDGHGPSPHDAVFCNWSHGWRKNMYLIGFFTVISVSYAVVNLFAFLLWRHLNDLTNMFSTQTIEVHHKFLRYLLINTAVPLIFGGIPLLICLFFSLFPHISYSREVTMIGIVILYNHGAIYSTVSIATFKPYHNAAKSIMRRYLRLGRAKVRTVAKKVPTQ